MPGPILFCYDGSAGSQAALRAAGDFLARPSDGFVLTVWQPLSFRLAATAAFAPLALADETELDDREAKYAEGAAEEGARLARDHGYDLVPLVEQANESIAHAILGVADRYRVGLIVCGQRGRGPLRSTLLGSVSHGLSTQTRRPLLISPENP